MTPQPTIEERALEWARQRQVLANTRYLAAFVRSEAKRLERWLDHTNDCEVYKEDMPCSCGLAEAKKELGL